MWFKKKELPPVRNLEEQINKNNNIKPPAINSNTLPPQPETYKKPEIRHEEPKHEQEPPLFIKLEKYRSIVSDIGTLKSSLALVKNSLIGIERLQKTQEETIAMLKKSVDRIEERLNQLSSKIVKPSMFPMIPELVEAPVVPETPEGEERHELNDLNVTIASLKSQIDQLKKELQTMSQ